VLRININGNFKFAREIVGDIEELEIAILPGKLTKRGVKK
jgi:hypothetical protein